MIIDYFLFACTTSIMSIIDVTFTFWYLRKLKAKNMPNVYNREINPLARYIMKKYGIGVFAYLFCVCNSQIILWGIYLFIMKEFVLIFLGSLFAVFMYHYAIYKDIKRFDNDKKYWDSVKYKMTKTGDKI